MEPQEWSWCRSQIIRGGIFDSTTGHHITDLTAIVAKYGLTPRSPYNADIIDSAVEHHEFELFSTIAHYARCNLRNSSGFVGGWYKIMEVIPQAGLWDAKNGWLVERRWLLLDLLHLNNGRSADLSVIRASLKIPGPDRLYDDETTFRFLVDNLGMLQAVETYLYSVIGWIGDHHQEKILHTLLERTPKVFGSRQLQWQRGYDICDDEMAMRIRFSRDCWASNDPLFMKWNVQALVSAWPKADPIILATICAFLNNSHHPVYQERVEATQHRIICNAFGIRY